MMMPNNDLLVRIDERVKALQEDFHELRQDIKDHRRDVADLKKKVYGIMGGLAAVQFGLNLALKLKLI